MTDATRFPLDFDVVQKGDFIAAEVIADAYETTIDSDTFRLAQVKFKQLLERELVSRHGTLWTIKCEGNGLRVLTDPEAAVYTERQFQAGQRAMVWNHARARAVEIERLTADEQREHERRIRQQGVTLQVMREAERLAAQGKELRLLREGGKEA